MVLSPFVRKGWALLAFCLAAIPFPADALAIDSVSIRYLDSHPIPGRSMERQEFRISRTPSAHPGSESSSREIDRYFEELSALLVAGHLDHDWQLAIPDAPAIEIVIERNGKKRTLVSCHTLLERDPEIAVTKRGVVRVAREARKERLARESEAFRRHREAFEAILRLSLERLHSRFAGGS